MRRPYWIQKNANPYDFPPVETALTYPDGLLAVGGDLSLERLIVAYHLGIFPWYNEDEPILWWAPSQRMVLLPEKLKISRSLRKTIQKKQFTLTIDQCFQEVVNECAGLRTGQKGTWINQDMIDAYKQLHQHGFAHSVEVWYEGKLVGGLYGVALGNLFCGESMFTRVSDASKVAFVHLVKQLQQWGYELIDCQLYTHHLASFGAEEIPREQFKRLLTHLRQMPGYQGVWQLDQQLEL